MLLIDYLLKHAGFFERWEMCMSSFKRKSMLQMPLKISLGGCMLVCSCCSSRDLIVLFSLPQSLLYNGIQCFSFPGRPIIVEFSSVTDFREATCRQYEEKSCNRGGYCNFMHLKKISRYQLSY